ncbi:MAG TPA: GNAT family acetyltransferase [Xanthobacteraceae bacterium]|nr:GNAT family acetyltransferase [Xanthobacteraceae bacterium]
MAIRRTNTTSERLKRLYELTSIIYFFLATAILMLLALVLLVVAVWDVVIAIQSSTVTNVIMDAIGLLIIGFAIVETGKFIAEEELFRQRELGSASESRRSLTKFVTIIVIAASLEALVMTFKAGQTDLSYALYPALLFVAAMLGLVCLGIYQWLSSRIESSSE